MLVVLVGLRFGAALFLWRSEDRAPANVLLLPLLRVRGMPLPSAGKLRELKRWSWTRRVQVMTMGLEAGVGDYLRRLKR